MLINRHHIQESFSFAAWQRLHDLGLSEEGIEAKRLEFSRALLSELVDTSEFTDKLVELGIAVLKIKVVAERGWTEVAKPGHRLHQSIAMAGPAEGFAELERWLAEKINAPFRLLQHLEWHHANSPLVMDRWLEAVRASRPFATGAFSERGAQL